MKNNFTRFLLVLLVVLGCLSAFAQNELSTTTIIIVRHAEKELAGSDPALTPMGMDRASKLSEKFPGKKPDLIFTTPYIRTKATVTPWAKEIGVEISLYDPKDLPFFADSLRQLKGKTILVAGHSNTNPQLVNLLIGDQKYQSLSDSDYNTIFVVTLGKGITKAEIIK